MHRGRQTATVGLVPAAPNSAPGPFSLAVAAILRDEFDQISMSRRQLAPLVGLSYSQLAKLFRGERVMDLEQLDAICRELGLSVTEIVDAADFARRAE